MEPRHSNKKGERGDSGRPTRIDPKRLRRIAIADDDDNNNDDIDDDDIDDDQIHRLPKNVNDEGDDDNDDDIDDNPGDGIKIE